MGLSLGSCSCAQRVHHGAFVTVHAFGFPFSEHMRYRFEFGGGSTQLSLYLQLASDFSVRSPLWAVWSGQSRQPSTTSWWESEPESQSLKDTKDEDAREL